MKSRGRNDNTSVSGRSSREVKRRGDVSFSGWHEKLMGVAVGMAVILWVVPLSSVSQQMHGKCFPLPGGEEAGGIIAQTAEERNGELRTERTAEQQEEPEAQPEAQPEKMVAGPQNIKEKTAVYVFLGWLWVSIGVLVYVLRLKIKEVDRLHAIKFFSPDRK